MTHIAVDLDDVMLDFVGGLITAVKKEYDVDITPQQLADTGWDLHPLLDPIIGRSWWSWLRDRDWLWAQFPAINGAIGGIDKLRRQGHYLELVTSKPEWAEHNVYRWLGKWRPAFQRVTIISLETRKVDVTDATWLVDDKPENIKHFTEQDRKGILFTRPHNEGDRTARGMYVADTWSQIVSTINHIEHLENINGR